MQGLPAQLSSLPTEIILLVLSHLHPPSLASCQRVCRNLQRLANEDDVWRRVAIQQGYADERHVLAKEVLQWVPEDLKRLTTATSSHCLLQDQPKETSENILSRLQEHPIDYQVGLDTLSAFPKSAVTDYYSGNIETFQDLCRKKWCLDVTWQCLPGSRESGIHAETGETFSIPNRLEPVLRNLDAAPPYVGIGWHQNEGLIEEVGRDIWRIKIDPVAKTLISTGQRGGVRVVDIITGEVLWRLDRQITRNFCHIEFDRGHLVFDRSGQGLEVWKRSDLMDNGDTAGRGAGRGSYTLDAGIFTPRPTRALRFQFPTLAVASQDGHVLMIDVVSKDILYDYSLEGSMHAEANINYIDFDDDFVFLAGTGAKCVSVLSRKLGKIIWTLADPFETDLPGPETYVLEEESPHVPARYASLERRKLKRASPSAWQKSSGRQNLAQLMMTPIQSWSAIHPDHRSRTLVILGQTNVVLIRDYLTYLLAWQRKKEQELLGKVFDDKSDSTTSNLAPDLFVDLRFRESQEAESDISWDELPTSQLAVAESRAMCIVGKAMLLDLDPLRLTRNDVRNIGLPQRLPSSQIGDLVSDEEAGFAVYDNIKPSHDNPKAEEARFSSLQSCSCVMMDSTSAYAVQVHEARSATTDGSFVNSSLAMTEYFDVLVWDFSKEARKHW